jgi:Flp pilus assembly protein TadD
MQMTGIAEIIQCALDYHRAGRLERAQELYQQVLQDQPENPDVLHLLGTLSYQTGRHDVAVELVCRAIAGEPGIAQFHNTLGVILQALGKPQESLDAYHHAISLKPDFAEPYSNMASVLQSLSRYSEAIEKYEQALQLAPGCAEIHYNLASTLQSQGRRKEAARSFRQALKLRPEYAQAHNNLAIILREQGKLDEAVESYEQAIRLEPDCALFHSNLASLLQYQGRLAQAVAHCEKAVSLKPDCAEVYYNLASVLRDQGLCDATIEQNHLAIRLRPDYAEAHWNLAISHLLNGGFSDGWKEYEWRRKTDWHIFDYPHKHQEPRWDGASFRGQRLLVHCEQGLGDCIQFVRYLQMVKALGGVVVFEAWKSLHGLLKEFDGIDELAELSFEKKTQAQFDSCASIMDLPGIFGTTEETIPAQIPYIHADPVKARYWRRKLVGPDFKVGIVWAGSARHTNDHNRSCRLEYFAPIAQIEGVRLYGLQKGEPAGQVDEFTGKAAVENLAEHFEDFTDAAAAIENLDLVISVDTAVLHLAGAMGKPAWALLAFAPDWRWMLKRADSPWYPTMRLFRQKEWGDWNSVFRNVTEELRVLADKKKIRCQESRMTEDVRQ